MKKSNNAKTWKELEKQGLANVSAVEIETSAPDSGAWYESKERGKNVYIRDRQYRPTIKATIHNKNGSRSSREIKSPKSYYDDRKKAKRIADEEAQAMWKVAREKGVPVIMKTGTHKQHATITKSAAYLKWEHEWKQRQAENDYMESPRGRFGFAVFSVALIVLCFLGWYGIAFLAAWIGL